LELGSQAQLVFLDVQLPITRALLNTLLPFRDVFTLLSLGKKF
jgi:hypothetical protein